MAKASQFVLPTIMAPAALSRATDVASYEGTYPLRTLDPAVVSVPAVQSVSCTQQRLPSLNGRNKLRLNASQMNASAHG